METSFDDACLKLFLDSFDLDGPLTFVEYAGCEGIGRTRELLLNMITTVAMVGLLATLSSTQSNPIWMHLIISSLELLCSV